VKLVNWLCLKYLGRISVANLFLSVIMKAFPPGNQEIIPSYFPLSRTSKSFIGKVALVFSPELEGEEEGTTCSPIGSIGGIGGMKRLANEAGLPLFCRSVRALAALSSS
jgi:hypothetical protein